ncbi:hypothetical protein AB0894_06415 [Streptomyces sp. NPDC047916]|uniref:hypothetical protein n=1 Tax=Streptomyces sp. NPDC047916 TaxID=3156681 RepID=UPI003456C5FB
MSSYGETGGRRSATGVRLQDPQDFLHYAYAAAGLDERDAVAYWPSRSGPPKAQLLEDLRGLSEAWRVLVKTPNGARSDLRLVRARCAAAIGEVQAELGDLAAAVEQYRTSVHLLDALPLEESRGDLATALNCLAILLRREGETKESLRASDHAVDAARTRNGAAEASSLLGTALLTKANTVAATGDAESLYEAAVEACRASGAEEGEAKAVGNFAVHLEAKGARDRAAELWARADRLLAGFDRSERPDLQAVRALLWLNRAELAPSGSAVECDCALRVAKLIAPLIRAGHHAHAGERAAYSSCWGCARNARAGSTKPSRPTTRHHGCWRRQCFAMEGRSSPRSLRSRTTVNRT